jgi:hypothetical protein
MVDDYVVVSEMLYEYYFEIQEERDFDCVSVLEKLDFLLLIEDWKNQMVL